MQKKVFRIQSAGAAYNLNVGFHGTKIQVYNYTDWGTDTKNVLCTYIKGMPPGSSLTEVSENTSANRTLDTSNGFTPIAYDQTAFAGAPTTINDVSIASVAVCTTTAAHGYTTGQKVRIRGVVGTVGTFLNDGLYLITVVSTTTFSLQDQRGNNIDSSTYAYTSGGQAYNITEPTRNENFIGYTIGTIPMAANDSILFVECEDADDYRDLGDVA